MEAEMFFLASLAADRLHEMTEILFAVSNELRRCTVSQSGQIGKRAPLRFMAVFLYVRRAIRCAHLSLPLSAPASEAVRGDANVGGADYLCQWHNVLAGDLFLCHVYGMTATKLKALRRKLKLTQAALADKLGVEQSTVHRWERGERRISGPAQKLLEQFAT